MRGRDLFKIFQPLLVGGRFLCRIFPTTVCELMLALLRHVPTKIGIALRYILISRLASSCGENVAVFEGVHLFRLGRMNIGSNVSIHEMSYLDATGGLSIGNDVSIAHAVSIMTTTHDYSNPHASFRDAPVINESVTIRDGVWVGAGARILSGVTIGEHSVVAAGAVVTRDVTAESIFGGIPARLLKEIRVVSN